MDDRPIKRAKTWAVNLTPFILILITTILAFLPFIFRLGYYRDDWYYMADGYFTNASIFHTMFWVDRPARGYLFEFLYRIFSTNATYYLLLMVFWRFLAGIFDYLTLRTIWPEYSRRNILTALLFVAYPGFLWWVSGVEYQPMVMALAMQMASIWFTVLTIKYKPLWKKGLFFIISLGTGLANLFLVDYAIGLELFRVIVIFWMIRSKGNVSQFIPALKKSLKYWLPFLLIPLSFVYWRLFRFANARPETDISIQMGKVLHDPFNTIFTWVENLIRSMITILWHGWFESFTLYFHTLTILQKGLVLLIAVAGTLVVGYALRLLTSSSAFKREAIVFSQRSIIPGGLLGILGGVLPVILMNRVVLIQGFSHYALPATICAALVIVEVCNLSRSRLINTGVPLLLLGIALASTNSQALSVLKEETKIKNFWQQFSLRVPDLKPGTTLLVGYPGIQYGEDIDIVWGPANFIYLSRDKVVTTDGMIEYPYAAVKINSQTLSSILAGGSEVISYRSHVNTVDYDKLLVVSQPIEKSCVHVFDSNWPMINPEDPDPVIFASSYSRIDNINPSQKTHTLDPLIFGANTTNDWCTYYEQADLALQQGEWNKVLDVFRDTQSRNLEPQDAAEWFPFLHAGIITGNDEVVEFISNKLNSLSFYQKQMCQLYTRSEPEEFTETSILFEKYQNLFCK